MEQRCFCVPQMLRPQFERVTDLNGNILTSHVHRFSDGFVSTECAPVGISAARFASIVCGFIGVKNVLSLPSPSLNDLCCGIASTLRLEPEDCILCGLLVSASDCENQQGGKGDQETRRLRGGEPSCETSSAL